MEDRFDSVYPEQVWLGVVRHFRLSPRQAAVARMLRRGAKDNDITSSLKMSKPTLRGHLRQICLRVSARTRVELVITLYVTAARIAMKK